MEKRKGKDNIRQILRVLPPQWRRVITLILIALGGLSGLEALTGADVSPPFQTISIQRKYTHPEKGWVTMRDAERESGYSRASLYTMARSGKIRAAKDGRGRWRFDPASLPKK